MKNCVSMIAVLAVVALIGCAHGKPAEHAQPAPAERAGIDSIITDENNDGVVSVGDFYEHHYSDGSVHTGVIQQLHLDPVFKDGFDTDHDGKVQVEEFQAWGRHSTGQEWNIRLEKPTTLAIIYDLNNDGAVSIGDRYQYHYDDTGFVAYGSVTQAQLDAVVKGGYDANKDGAVQPDEFGKMLEATTHRVWKVALEPTEWMKVKVTVYDEDGDGTVSAGDISGTNIMARATLFTRWTRAE